MFSALCLVFFGTVSKMDSSLYIDEGVGWITTGLGFM